MSSAPSTVPLPQTHRPRVFQLPAIPDSQVGQEYFTLLLQIESTKSRLRTNIAEIRKTANAPFEFLESTKDVLAQAAEIPVNALHTVEDKIGEYPWASMGGAVATGAVAGYFDDGRLERLIGALPGEIATWLGSLLSSLASAAAGAANQLVTQSVVGAVSGAAAAATATSMSQDGESQDIPPEHRRAPVDVDEYATRSESPLSDPTLAASAV